MLRSRIPAILTSKCIYRSQFQRRWLHKVIKLPYEDLEPSVNGIYPLYSKEGFHLAWTERQESLINEVNRITQGIHFTKWN